MSESETKSLRWGIIGCGLISSWFVSDIVLDRPSVSTKHIVQAIGSSSLEKAKDFTKKWCPSATPTLYANYEEVYNDPNVDVVYLGTPHAYHFQNALDAINAGKNVLCEKPMTINAKQTELLIAAARKQNVFFMEGLWTRFFPIVKHLQKLIHTEKVIGDISRVFIDFGLDMPIASLPKSSRVADPALGAGALLDIGIYTLTWESIILGQHPDVVSSGEVPNVVSSMNLNSGADEMTSMIITYPKLQAQAICTCSMRYKGAEEFCRIEGSLGSISIGGPGTSKPDYLMIRKKGSPEEKIDFSVEGWGFWYEQDAIAECIQRGEKESAVMPTSETLRILRLMDGVRQANGLKYIQDD